MEVGPWGHFATLSSTGERSRTSKREPKAGEVVRIMVTGSTGMVGAHTAAALQRAGHELRLLVRDPSRIPRALAPLGVPTPQYVIGSVTDAEAVEEAFRGCDAAVHAAALLSFDRARDAEMQRTNVEGSRLVLETGVRLGLDPIVYVSSLAALFPTEGSLLTAEESVKSPRDLYARSKAAGERVARALQARRAPVVITYPGGVFGPDDPTVNDGVRLIVKFLTSGAFPVTSGGISFIDIRDIAAVHAAVRVLPVPGGPRTMEKGRLAASVMASICDGFSGGPPKLRAESTSLKGTRDVTSSWSRRVPSTRQRAMIQLQAASPSSRIMRSAVWLRPKVIGCQVCPTTNPDLIPAGKLPTSF